MGYILADWLTDFFIGLEAEVDDVLSEDNSSSDDDPEPGEIRSPKRKRNESSGSSSSEESMDGADAPKGWKTEEEESRMKKVKLGNPSDDELSDDDEDEDLEQMGEELENFLDEDSQDAS